MTGYLTDNPDPANAVELWPRFRRREESLYALHNFNPAHDHYLHQTPLNLMALFDAWEMLGKRPLERDFARGLVRIPKERKPGRVAGFVSGEVVRSREGGEDHPFC